MEFKEFKLKGVYSIKLNPIYDNRGFFMRYYDQKLFAEKGLATLWVQDNQSVSTNEGTLRGLHFILPPHTDGKLIRCIAGRIWDVFVDIRKNSATFGEWECCELSGEEHSMLYIPRGFAHGFCTLEDNTVMLYKHDMMYHKESDSGIIWNDRDLNINWPVQNPIISERDSALFSLRHFINLYGGI